ncbi:MAG TPA: MFS transporter [Candidatus Limnocylindrales bacterium]|nr:MFS transporter [Candidatus Limnocylindrales bacterium]
MAEPAVGSGAGGAGRAVPGQAVLIALATFAFIAATNILTPLLPLVRDDLGVSISTAGIIVGSYGLARLAVDLPAGFLADRVGHRRLAVIAIVLLVGSSLVGWLASGVEMLIASRIGSGAAVGILAMVGISALAATASSANRGRVMSLFHLANNTGIALYPLLGGFIGAAAGWRPTFLVTAVLAVVAGAILFALLPRIDFGHAAAARPGRNDESRVLHGRTRTRAMIAANAGIVANMIHRHGIRNTILPLYAATALGLGGISIATAIALMSVTGLIVATPGGMLGDRIGRRRVIVSGLTALAIGDLAFLLTGDLVTFLAVSALIGFGDFFTSSQTALLSEIVPVAERTRSLSTYRFSSDLGSMIGPILLAAVMDGAGAPAAIVVAAVILASAALAGQVFIPARVDAAESSRAPAAA